LGWRPFDTQPAGEHTKQGLGGLMKKLGMIVFSGLAALSLIGFMALVMFGAERLLRAVGVIGH